MRNANIKREQRFYANTYVLRQARLDVCRASRRQKNIAYGRELEDESETSHLIGNKRWWKERFASLEYTESFTE